MVNKEQSEKISSLLTQALQYAETGPLSNAFKNYLKEELSNETGSREKYFEILQAFLFDYKLNDQKTPLDIYIESKEIKSDSDYNIIYKWKNSVHSIFRVLKVQKDSFLCYNLVNEKVYTVKTLTNFLNFKGIGVNNYLFCRIVPFEDYHVIISNLIPFPASAKKEMLEMACMIQLENPAELSKDNPEKLEQIYENNAIRYQKFYDLFGSDQIFTSGKYVNEVLSLYSEYTEIGEIDKTKLESKILQPEETYFDPEIIKGLDESNMNPSLYLSAYTKCHDVGIIFDEKEGLSVLPYYSCFMKIFESKDFTKIKNYKECIMYYLENESISPFPFVKAITTHPVNSVNVFEDVLGQSSFSIEEDFDSLMEEYKYDFMYNNRVSMHVVYYQSSSFREILEIYENLAGEIANEDTIKHVGRNDPCPCGSGKKYKKCCQQNSPVIPG